VALASDLLAWMGMLALTGHDARRWEPKRLRHRLFTIPATIARTARQTLLHLSDRAPTILLYLQTMAGPRHPIRQTRPHLPRRHSARTAVWARAQTIDQRVPVRRTFNGACRRVLTSVQTATENDTSIRAGVSAKGPLVTQANRIRRANDSCMILCPPSPYGDALKDLLVVAVPRRARRPTLPTALNTAPGDAAPGQHLDQEALDSAHVGGHVRGLGEARADSRPAAPAGAR